MPRTPEITDKFNTFDEIYLVFTLKNVNILYLFSTYKIQIAFKVNVLKSLNSNSEYFGGVVGWCDGAG